MTIKKHDFGFWCKFCESAQYVKNFDYAETDDFHEYRVICPSCGNHLTIRQRTAMSYVRQGKF